MSSSWWTAGSSTATPRRCSGRTSGTSGAIHEAFVGEYVRRRADFEVSGSLISLLLGLSDWLDDWLHEHIRGVDTQMADYLRSPPRP